MRLSQLLRSCGLDRATANASGSQLWTLVSGPVTLLLIATRLTGEEQGFYYTFASILGLQIFFELGLAYVILQFASHEKAHLTWTPHGTLTGDPQAKARLASLLRLGLIWYSVVAVCIVGAVLPGGWLFFHGGRAAAGAVRWQLPWVWAVGISACLLCVCPVFAVLEGCGQVAEVTGVQLGQSILSSLVFWWALSRRWRLFAAPVPNTVILLYGLVWLVVRRRAFLVDLLRFSPGLPGIRWWSDIWPFQWRIAVSWLSSYFIFQLFTPVLFHFSGAVVAGQMGMCLAAVRTLGAAALAWITTKAAPFGTLIARRQFDELDRRFFPALWQSLSVAAIGGAAFWIAVLYLHLRHLPLSGRLLGLWPLGLLLGAILLQHILSAQGVYLRAHKQEPFLGLSVLVGCLTGLSTYGFGRRWGATGMAAGYFGINLTIGLGLGTWIFTRKRRLWHAEPGVSAPVRDYLVFPPRKREESESAKGNGKWGASCLRSDSCAGSSRSGSRFRSLRAFAIKCRTGLRPIPTISRPEDRQATTLPRRREESDAVDHRDTHL